MNKNCEGNQSCEREVALSVLNVHCCFNGEYGAMGGVDFFQCISYEVEWTLHGG